MSGRRIYLDDAPGERRGVVTLDGRPERLLISRDGDFPVQQLGARVAARVRTVERALSSAFLDLGEGPDALLSLTGPAASLHEGAAIEVEIVAEARRDKGAIARLIGKVEGSPRLISPAPSMAERLRAFAPEARLVEDALAREAADAAEAAALAVEHGLPGGGNIAIEATRALVAVDVDLGAGRGDPRRVARQTNLLAIAHTARLLRLKALGGLVVIDLIGASHDGAALTAAVKAAFAPDEPGVSVGPVSRFGLLQLVAPHRFQPVADRMCDASGAPTAQTMALRLLRALEREGRADGGARLVGRCSPPTAQATDPHMHGLIQRIGARFEIRAEPAFAADQFDVSKL